MRGDSHKTQRDTQAIGLAEAISSAGANAWALLLLDMRFDSGAIDEDGEPRGNPDDDNFGELVRRRAAVEFPSLPVVVLTGKMHSELTELDLAYLSKEGIDDIAMSSCLLRYGRLDVDQIRCLLGLKSEIVARAPGTVAAFKRAWFAASSAQPVLILGETGVGKEVLAQYIHDHSGRKEFVGLNVAAVPPTLFESEMFGAIKAADRANIELEGHFGKRSLPWADVRGVFLRRPKSTAPLEPSKLVRVWLRTGFGNETDVLDGVLLRIGPEKVTLKHADLGELSLDRKWLSELRPRLGSK